MHDYFDSFNVGFGFGLSEKFRKSGFDILDNDYVEVQGWQINGYPHTFVKNPDYRLEKCDWKVDSPWASKDTFESWYPGAICFKNKKAVYISSNWW